MFLLVSIVDDSSISSVDATTDGANGASTNSPSSSSSNSHNKICLGYSDIFIALVLIVLILVTVFGNVLVVLSVFLYKRMRTFTNFLLTSLATADLLVGLLIMPLALFDLLNNHNWPLGRALCRIWATFDVLLCTASILNLCIISLDRYMAITSPLLYPRRRSRWMACALLCFVWGMSLVVCSPPWFVDEWGISFDSKVPSSSSSSDLAITPPITSVSSSATRSRTKSWPRIPRGATGEDGAYQCAYPMSVSYRIYSASVSFYIPLVVMLFVYFKIFRVASERERLIREGMGTCRLSRRLEKTQLKGRKRSATTNYTRRSKSNCPRLHDVIQSALSPTKPSMDFCTGQTNLSSNHCAASPANPANSRRPSRPNQCRGALPPLPMRHQCSEDRPTTSPTNSARNSINNSNNNRRGTMVDELGGMSCDSEETSCPSARNSGRGVGPLNSTAVDRPRCADSLRRKIKSMECLGSSDNYASARQSTKYRKNSADPTGNDPHGEEMDQQDTPDRCRPQNLQPPGRLANGARPSISSNSNAKNANAKLQQQQMLVNAGKAMAVVGGQQQQQFTAKNANLRGSKEKIVYLRERKALKTIGIVVLGFIVCWLPFFVVYVLEVSPVLKKAQIIGKREFQVLSEFFLWLGYSNSVLNPLIYTMVKYNSDFRRCFRDLLGFGCMNQHRRTMSVKKLHQQSTVF